MLLPDATKIGVHTPYSCFSVGSAVGHAVSAQGELRRKFVIDATFQSKSPCDLCVFSAQVSLIYSFISENVQHCERCHQLGLRLMCCGFQRDSCTPPLKVNLYLQNNTADNFDLFVDAQQGHSSSVNSYVNLTCLLTLTFYI